MNVKVIIDVIMAASVVMLAKILIGLSVFVVGQSLFKGKNWARLVTVASTIVSVPLVVLFSENLDNRVLLGMIAIDCIMLYYLMKPRVREYFSHSAKNSLKKPNIKT